MKLARYWQNQKEPQKLDQVLLQDQLMHRVDGVGRNGVGGAFAKKGTVFFLFL